jgi:hypothetical protein
MKYFSAIEEPDTDDADMEVLLLRMKDLLDSKLTSYKL